MVSLSFREKYALTVHVFLAHEIHAGRRAAAGDDAASNFVAWAIWLWKRRFWPWKQSIIRLAWVSNSNLSTAASSPKAPRFTVRRLHVAADTQEQLISRL